MSRRFRRGLNNREILGLAFLFVIGLRLAIGYAIHDPTKNRPEKFREGPIEIVSVLDGNTLLVRQADVSAGDTADPLVYESQLRLIGIAARGANGPSDAQDSEVVEFAHDFLSRGPARLRLDKRRKDPHGRLLGYVYVNDQSLNEELVRAGLMRVATYPGDNQSLERRLLKAEAEAIAREREIPVVAGER